MKKYIFTLDLNTDQEKGVDQIPVIAKNIQSAIAKLCQGDFYKEDQIVNIAIIKN